MSKRCKDCVWWLWHGRWYYGSFVCQHYNSRFGGFTCPKTKICYHPKWYVPIRNFIFGEPMSLNEEPDTKEYCVPIYKWNELVEEKLALRTQLAEAKGEIGKWRNMLQRLLSKLPHSKHDYSGVGWCAGCGAVLYVSGDGKGRDPCKPDCILQEAEQVLKENKDG